MVKQIETLFVHIDHDRAVLVEFTLDYPSLLIIAYIELQITDYTLSDVGTRNDFQLIVKTVG